MWILFADLEGSGLASDCLVSGSVWASLRLWAAHLDHQGQRESFQETVCGLCHWEAAAHRQLHRIQLQPPSPAVSILFDLTKQLNNCHYINQWFENCKEQNIILSLFRTSGSWREYSLSSASKLTSPDRTLRMRSRTWTARSSSWTACKARLSCYGNKLITLRRGSPKCLMESHIEDLFVLSRGAL